MNTYSCIYCIYIYIYTVPSQNIDPRHFWGVKIKFMNKPPVEGGQYFATLFSGIFSSIRTPTRCRRVLETL
eukprot:jgi/Botrbrau1/6874/Bobra.152_2s0030.1